MNVLQAWKVETGFASKIALNTLFSKSTFQYSIIALFRVRGRVQAPKNPPSSHSVVEIPRRIVMGVHTSCI